MLRAWQRLGLSRQFLLMAGISLAVLSSVAGTLQTRLMVANLVETSAQLASAYMRSIIAPYLRELEDDSDFSSSNRKQLEQALERTRLDSRIKAITIWRPDGTIIYSTSDRPVRQRLGSEQIQRAAMGEIVASLNDGSDRESWLEQRIGEDVIAIYVPIHGSQGRVIAVGEFRQALDELRSKAIESVVGLWIIRASSLAFGIFVLFLLVRRTHAVIDSQQEELRRHLLRERRLALRNLALRQEADEARLTAVNANEDLLSRIGAEIHDGPLQLLTLAMLSLDDKQATVAQEQPRASALTAEAVAELRQISRGLILPEIEKLNPSEVVRLAVRHHEELTGTHVDLELGALPQTACQALKACIYRVVQECLNNSAKHAGGRLEKVVAAEVDGTVRLIVSDKGPGMKQSPESDGRAHLGLLGIRNRVQALGGSLAVDSAAGSGTRITVVLPLERAEQRYSA